MENNLFKQYIKTGNKGKQQATATESVWNIVNELRTFVGTFGGAAALVLSGVFVCDVTSWFSSPVRELGSVWPSSMLSVVILYIKVMLKTP